MINFKCRYDLRDLINYNFLSTISILIKNTYLLKIYHPKNILIFTSPNSNDLFVVYLSIF